MKKRMILMLVVVTVFIAAIGIIKFRQVKGAIAQAGVVPAASRGGDHDRRPAGGVADER